MALAKLVPYLVGVGILVLEDFLFGLIGKNMDFVEFFDFVELGTAGDQNG